MVQDLSGSLRCNSHPSADEGIGPTGRGTEQGKREPPARDGFYIITTVLISVNVTNFAANFPQSTR